MLYLYTLTIFVVVIGLIFATPLRYKSWMSLGLTSMGALWGTFHAIQTLLTGEQTQLWMIPDTPLGMDSGVMDSLSALFVVMIAVGAISSTIYSRGYLEHTLKHKSPAHLSLHYSSLTLMSLSMMAVVVSNGGFSFLFFWEMMTIASFLLILYDAERREVQRAALSYLIMMHVGFVLLVVGFVRLYAITGSSSFSALTDYFSSQPVLPLFFVFLMGFGMKAGLFPLHVWLPEAHPAAPSHVSALMSGIMIKTGIYGILRVTAAITDLEILSTVGLIIFTVGIITGLWGVMLAAVQNDIKRLMAYSSIENIGVILLALGVAALGKASQNNMMEVCGITGALLHTINHSFFKTLLFYGAGNVLSQTHTTSLDRLGGLAKHMPMTALLFGAGIAAICALPPLNGFVSELMIYLGMLNGISLGSDVLASVAGLAALALIGGVVVIACTKLFGIIFLGSPRTHEVAESEEVDNQRIVAMAIPLTGILLVGLFPQGAISVVARASGFFLGAEAESAETLLQLSPIMVSVCRAAWILVGILLFVGYIRHRLMKGKDIRQGSTWGCGFTAINVKMQYTGESFSERLQSIARPLTKDTGEGSSIHKSEIFPRSHNFDIRHKDRIGRLFSAWWMGSLQMINSRVMRLRTGKINHYILFALAFLVLVFLLSIFHQI